MPPPSEVPHTFATALPRPLGGGPDLRQQRLGAGADQARSDPQPAGPGLEAEDVKRRRIREQEVRLGLVEPGHDLLNRPRDREANVQLRAGERAASAAVAWVKWAAITLAATTGRDASSGSDHFARSR